MGLNMETQNVSSEDNPTIQLHESHSSALDDALLLLSRLFGRQCALDFLKDADILGAGEPE